MNQSMKKTLLTLLATTAAISAQTALAETVGIANAADWAAFANRVNAGETTLDAEMTANVTLTQDSPRVGTNGNPYGGAFDGQGHRLTLNWNLPGVDFAAPFAYVAGAAISNLHTMGSITTDRHFTSGLIGDVKLPGTTTAGNRETSRHHDFQLSFVRRNHQQLFRGHDERGIHFQNDPGGRYQDRQLPF